MKKPRPNEYPFVATLKEKDPQIVRKLCHTAGCIPARDWTILTEDLLSMINRLNYINIEHPWLTWHTTHSLSILINENLCEAAFCFVHNKKIYCYNLTNTKTPYWSMYWFYCDCYDSPPHYPIYVNDLKGCDFVENGLLFVRPVDKAKEILLKYPLDKPWFTDKGIAPKTEEWSKKYETECHYYQGKEWLQDRECIVINDGTQPVPDDFDRMMRESYEQENSLEYKAKQDAETKARIQQQKELNEFLKDFDELLTD